jgi:hypothetical protein
MIRPAPRVTWIQLVALVWLLAMIFGCLMMFGE